MAWAIIGGIMVLGMLCAWWANRDPRARDSNFLGRWYKGNGHAADIEMARGQAWSQGGGDVGMGGGGFSG